MPDDSDRIKTQHGVMSWDDLLVHCRNTAESFRQRGQRALSANDLRKNVSEIADDLSALYTYMVSDPSRVISGGRHLTETEYYLFRAYANTMVKLPDFRLWPGLQDLGEYGVWQMLQYEDEHVISFINVWNAWFGEEVDPKPMPTSTPMSGRVRVGERLRFGFGIQPEDCYITALRLEQNAYFAKYAPEILTRMKPNPKKTSD